MEPQTIRWLCQNSQCARGGSPLRHIVLEKGKIARWRVSRAVNLNECLFGLGMEMSRIFCVVWFWCEGDWEGTRIRRQVAVEKKDTCVGVPLGVKMRIIHIRKDVRQVAIGKSMGKFEQLLSINESQICFQDSWIRSKQKLPHTKVLSN